MIGAPASKVLQPETRASAMSAVPVALALLLHGVHMLIVSAAAAGTAGMEMHLHMHHDAMTGMSAFDGAAHHFGGTMPWMTLLVIALNACGSFFAARMLWRVWKSKRRDRHALLCCAVAVCSIAVGIGSTGLLL